MSAHRAGNWALAFAIATIMSCTYLLDGPTELEAAQAVAEEVQAAPEYVAADARITKAIERSEHKDIVAQVSP